MVLWFWVVFPGFLGFGVFGFWGFSLVLGCGFLCFLFCAGLCVMFLWVGALWFCDLVTFGLL